MRVAHLARIELADSEIEHLAVQLSQIIAYADRIRALDTEGVPPTAHPVPLANVLRDDVPGPTVNREVFLAQAPTFEDGYVRVPKILDESGGGHDPGAIG